MWCYGFGICRCICGMMCRFVVFVIVVSGGERCSCVDGWVCIEGVICECECYE